MKTKIEWTDMTWNPAWGCLNNCEYCYARSIAKRFGKTEDEKNFIPTWRESNFNKKFPKKPSRIFVNSMSDIFYWEPEWMEKVLKKIKEYPQHTFQFLTKLPEIYTGFEFPENCWLGVTIENNTQFDKLQDMFDLKYNGKINIIFASIEPITTSMNGIDWFLQGWDVDQDPYTGDPRQYQTPELDWIIVGVETGNRKNKIIPEKQWIEEIKDYCKNNNTKYFEKDSIKPIVNRELIREFPKG
ncbi:DUF5131 family protein [Candidatus Pacearchaeota archaeon]|nr:DUF5131 family protein [Candidatus Pacearchaeota archaeon]